MDNKIDIEKLLDEADDLVDARNYVQAIANYNHILEHDSDCADALLMRGALLGEQGDVEGAVADIEKSITIDRTNDSSFLTLAYLYNRKKDIPKVIELSAAALDLNGDNTEAMTLLLHHCKELGDEFLEISKFNMAEYYFDLALKYKSDDTVILYRRALTARGVGKIQEGIAFAERAVQSEKNNIRGRAFIASLYEVLGEIEKGSGLIRELYLENKNHPLVCIVFAQYALREKRQEEGISVLEEMIRWDDIHIKDLIDAKWLLGSLYDSLDQFDKAFGYFKQSNDLIKDDYNPAEYQAYITGLITYFTKEKYSSLPVSDYSGDELIFIIGMPRSGTSLIEQIISSHSDVFGAGELTHVYRMVDTIQEGQPEVAYPGCLDSVSKGTINKYAHDLLSKIRNEKIDSPDSVRIIDKMPHNFHHIGLLYKLFPKAKFINCVRDSRDNCLSCYFQNFAGYHPYACDLKAAAVHYLEYERLMRHWVDELDIPVLTVSYEAVVEDARNEVEKILGFLGLDWEDNCLEFYKQERTVATASYNQVNKKIYNRSVGRWKNYKRHIAELIEVLEGG